MAPPVPRKQATRARITAAALALFTEGGYLESTVEDIISAAGVSRWTFYAHFSNKADLLSALVDDNLVRRADRFRELVELPVLTPVTATRWLVALGLGMRRERGSVRLFRLAVALDAGLMRRFAEGRDRYVAILGRGFPRFDASTGSPSQRERKRVAAHLFVLQIEQYVASMADDSWVLDPETTAQELAATLFLPPSADS